MKAVTAAGQQPGAASEVTEGDGKQGAWELPGLWTGPLGDAGSAHSADGHRRKGGAGPLGPTAGLAVEPCSGQSEPRGRSGLELEGWRAGSRAHLDVACSTHSCLSVSKLSPSLEGAGLHSSPLRASLPSCCWPHGCPHFVLSTRVWRILAGRMHPQRTRAQASATEPDRKPSRALSPCPTV